MFKHLFDLLFKKNELICTGNFKSTDLTSSSTREVQEFFSINPLKESRKDLNVTAFRNFLFEMDTLALEEQQQLLKTNKIPLTSVVYSGSKSYHIIISLENDLSLEPHKLESIQKYKETWKAIASYIAKEWNIDVKLFDESCKNPSRFSRFPGFIRSNGNEQSQILLGSIWSDEQLQSVLRDGPEISSRKLHSRFEGKLIDSGSKNFLCNSESEVVSKMPLELKAKLNYPATWAKGEAGNYPELLKLTLWLIDSTNASYEVTRNLFNKKSFPFLIKAGYPINKLEKALKDAYKMKFGSL